VNSQKDITETFNEGLKTFLVGSLKYPDSSKVPFHLCPSNIFIIVPRNSYRKKPTLLKPPNKEC